MQRLFSMFPRGAPGAALLVLRIAVGAGLVDESWSAVEGADPDWIRIAASAMAGLLLFGFLTPVICALCILAEIAAWVHGGLAWPPTPLCVVPMAIALALLGPGAYSVDARMFGRRKLLFPPPGPGSE